MSKEFTQPDDRGLWRFGIISPLLHRTEDGPSMSAQIIELAQRTFYTPDGSHRYNPLHLRLKSLHFQLLSDISQAPKQAIDLPCL